jgi:hypothetical protein
MAIILSFFMPHLLAKKRRRRTVLGISPSKLPLTLRCHRKHVKVYIQDQRPEVFDDLVSVKGA